MVSLSKWQALKANNMLKAEFRTGLATRDAVALSVLGLMLELMDGLSFFM
jgi:hypothetical protein